MPAYILRLLLFVLSCVVLPGCKPQNSPNKFSDDILVHISDLQDRRLGDSLLQFLRHPEAAYRQQAALAFASIQDTSATKALAGLLRDDDARVRLNAALALGQTGGSMSSGALMQAYAVEHDSLVAQTMLEAIGKVAEASEIQLEKYYGPGVPWLCYRLGLRQATPPEFSDRVTRYLDAQQPEFGRLGAAHFFAGAQTADITIAVGDLARALRSDLSAEVRMAAASALRKADSETAFTALSQAAALDADPRVRINAIKSLGSFTLSRTGDVLFKALGDTAINVSIAAAEVIQSVATEAFTELMLREARVSANWRVQALLYQGANWVAPNAALNQEIMKLCQSSSNPYQKSWLLSALNGIDAIPYVIDELLTTKIPVIRSSAARVLVAMNREEALTTGLRNQFLEAYKKGIAGGDVAVIGLFTEALADTTLRYRELVNDISFLHEAKARLSLPRDYESYVPLEHAIAFFEGREPNEIEKPFNHRIDWDLVRSIPASQRAILNTVKGSIVMSLHVEEAPGSVANFVKLIHRQYFDGKVVHRVVPNFVVQDGCHRGDGWGSEDYSIRSEFGNLRYVAGSVGMASAGKDTEGTQWFITHSPPPRLDGRYTIFGTVEDGMEVVDRIEVGDTIHSVELSPPVRYRQ